MKLKNAKKPLKTGPLDRFQNQNKLDEWPLSRYTIHMNIEEDSKNETFQQIPDYLLGELQENYLKPIDICVYFTLKSHAGQDRVCWPSISTIAKRCNRSTSTIDGSISRLKERGHIERKQKFYILYLLVGVSHYYTE